MDDRVRELTGQFARERGMRTSGGAILDGDFEVFGELMLYIEARMDWPPPRPVERIEGVFLL